MGEVACFVSPFLRQKKNDEEGNIIQRNKTITHLRHFSVIPERKTRAAEHVIVIASKSKSKGGICGRYWRRIQKQKKKDAAQPKHEAEALIPAC